MRTISSRLAVVLIAAFTLAAGLAACGGSGGGSSSSDASSTTSAEASSGSGNNQVTAAKNVIEPYVGHPSPFPVTEKLKEIPKGAKIAYVECGTTVCGLIRSLVEPAAAMLGVEFVPVKAGSAANSVANAFDSVLAGNFDAVIVPAIPIELWSAQLKELQAQNIPVVTAGVSGAEEFGIVAPQTAENMDQLFGKLMANYIVAKLGSDKNAVFYTVPELPFTGLTESAFNEEIAKVCPECNVRTSDLSVSTLGSTAPNAIVSDLQSNPETEVAVLGTDEIWNGVPQAVESAGIEVDTVGEAPSPVNLQYLKEGKETAAIGVDVAVLSWTLMDLAAREIVGQEPTGLEAEGIAVTQILEQKDITFDPSKGWSGYPEFPERFAKLWGVEAK